MGSTLWAFKTMPFEPGKSGNPGGRPKRDKMITQHLIAELGAVEPGMPGEKVRRIVIALIDKAMKGDVAAAREIMDRVEGRVTTVIGGDEERPLLVVRINRQTDPDEDDQITPEEIAAAKAAELARLS